MTTFYISAERPTNTMYKNAAYTYLMFKQLSEAFGSQQVTIDIVHDHHTKDGKSITEYETVLRVETNDTHCYSDYDIIWNMAQKFEQDSILMVKPDNLVALINVCSGQPHDLEYTGFWTEVTKGEAIANQYYTQIGTKYFIAR